jgi:HEAT repeat protein
MGSDAAAAVDELKSKLRDPDPRVRAAAAKSLGFIGRSAARAIPDLVTALDDENDKVAHSASRALRQIDPESAAVMGPKWRR